MHEIQFVGRKAFNLGILSNHVNVKPGFVLPVSMVESDTAPVFVLKNNTKYAVRSSAVGEDGSDHSWSGQFATILNVEGKDVLESLKKVSDSSLAAVQYQTIAGPHGGLAVIVQEMVQAIISGTLFTCNPSSGEKIIVIEVAEGFSDQLVSGFIAPYYYYIDKITGKILLEEGVSNARLNLAQIEELFTTAIKIEKVFNQPQDIEWAYDSVDGKLYINQSRNITGLNSKETMSRIGLIQKTIINHQCEVRRLSENGLSISENIFSDQNIAELITPYPSPMAFGLFTYIFAHGEGAIKTARNQMGYEIGDELNEGFFTLIGGQPRCSILHDALTYRIKGFPLEDYRILIDYYLGRIKENSKLANYPEVMLYNQMPTKEFLNEMFGIKKGRFLFNQYAEHEKHIKEEEHMIGQLDIPFRAEWKEIILELRERFDDKNLSLDKLVKIYFDCCELLRTKGCVAFVKVARLAFLSYTRLRNQLIEVHGEILGNQYANTVGAGAPGINPNLWLQRMLYHYKNGRINLGEIVKKFGHLSGHELEIEEPRYSEKTEIFEHFAKHVSYVPGQEEDLDESIMKQYMSLLGRFDSSNYSEGEKFRRNFNTAHLSLSLREVVKFEYLKVYQIIREVSLKINKLLNWKKDLIFNLDPKEIFELSNLNAAELFSIATEREKERAKNKEFFVPQVLFSDKLYELNYTSAATNVEGVLTGIGVTTYVYEGEVVVIESTSDLALIEKLSPGKVLVTITADPAWASLISAVCPNGGFITEIGGLLAHVANVSREMKVAAVLNVPNATKILKTGMIVRVDGLTGSVTIIN